MGKLVALAYEDLIKYLYKKLNKVNKAFSEFEKSIPESSESVFVEYDGMKLYTYDEIQMLYAYGTITSNKFDKLYSELMDKRKRFEGEHSPEYYTTQIRLLQSIIGSIQYTLECEQKKAKKGDDK